jgi:vancomycin resistance protein VanW
MENIEKSLKSHIRRSLKYGRTLLRGYPFYYGQIQDVPSANNYPYEWSHSTTTIKQRDGFANINQNRLWNMHLAVGKIDCFKLNPRQIFSFANSVGNPTVANGFREGPTLVNGQLQTESGGGLCQVSTTIYQALLMGGLEILERHNHSSDIHGSDRFFTLGQDAAVADGYKDLIARNHSQIPLMLRLQVLSEESVVKASVWGMKPCPFHIEIKSKVLAELPSPVAGGMSGWQVQTIRNLRPNDTSDWETDYSHIDIYQPYVKLHHSRTSNSTSIPQ